MEKVTLCKLDESYCPSVELHKDGKVTIGENGKVAELTKNQWNTLVEKILDGTLSRIR
ncbi:MAG: hypothetical protein AAB091_06750 [Elusimicrobiota bacterium]